MFTIYRYTVSTLSIRAAVAIAVCILLAPEPGRAQADISPLTALTGEATLKPGEKMYREGILPSGKPMQAVIKDDVHVDGTAFSCVSCHMRSGLGSMEGGVYTTPTNGRTLYQQRDLPGSGNNRLAGMSMADKSKGIPMQQPPAARPAYTDNTLAEVLWSGKDPAGRILDPVMPRYILPDKDMDILVSYLKNLSAEYSPGVDNYSINFATVIAEGVPADQVEAMMEPLESFVKSANKQQKDHEAQLVKLREIRREPTYRPVRLSRWLLKGPPESWRSQLEEYYRREPVFALVAGISPATWQPVHEFSEVNKIPCILPSTDFPVVSGSDWYTLYFSKGYHQEGSAAARYLKTQDRPALTRNIVQIFRNSPQGRSLAAGFEQELKEQGLPPAVPIQLKEGELLTQKRLQVLLDRHHPEAIALWGDAEDLKQAAAVPQILDGSVKVMASGTYLGKGLWTVPDRARAATYITWPYRLPQDEERFARFFAPSGTEQKMSDELRIIRSRTYAALLVLTQALRDMKGNFYRDYLFDVVSMKPDVDFPLYERLSFGPDQRYASKGCYVVQLSGGDKPELIKKSEWVIH